MESLGCIKIMTNIPMNQKGGLFYGVNIILIFI